MACRRYRLATSAWRATISSTGLCGSGGSASNNRDPGCSDQRTANITAPQSPPHVASERPAQTPCRSARHGSTAPDSRTRRDRSPVRACRRRPADQRIGFQHIDCRNDLVQACCDMCGLMALEVVEDPLKILCNLRCQLGTRHATGLVCGPWDALPTRRPCAFPDSHACRPRRWSSRTPRCRHNAARRPRSPPPGDCRRGKEKARQDRAVSCAAMTATLSACAPSTMP